MDGESVDVSTLLEDGMPVNGSDVELSRDENGTITALFLCGISVSFTNIENTLVIDIAVAEDFIGRTKGLMGAWNENSDDDFLRPDGKTLPTDATPQQIHYEFGLKCKFIANKY